MKTIALASLICVGLSFGAIARAAEDEKTELEGVWQQTKLIVDGEEKKVGPDVRLTIRGNTSTMTAAGKVVFSGIFKIDSFKSPKALEGTYQEGPNKGKKSSAIYKIDGDKLTTCRGAIDGPRPAAFESKPGAGGLLSEYKRIEK